jgi:alkylation response protein AidB-like acyl-CoA dehydrogenase
MEGRKMELTSASAAAPAADDRLDTVLTSITRIASARLGDEELRALDARDEMPVAVVRAMCASELGACLLFAPDAPTSVGGRAFETYRVCEELAHADLGVATGVLATVLGSDPIRVGGTREQRERWIGRIAAEGLLMAYLATEPQAGSDLAKLRTTAVPIEENGRVTGYRLSGHKQWISNGGVADLYTVLANTPGGPSWFVVDRGTPGLSAGRSEDKHGIRTSNTAAVHLDEVLVGLDRLVGGVEGRGLQQAQAVFGYARLMVAAFGLGAGWAALDRIVGYSATRTVGGGPLSQNQGYTHKLVVPHAVRLEGARAVIEETAARLDAGESDLGTEGAIAKLLASEAGNQAAEAAIQAHGGYGYTREGMVEKIKRDVRVTTIYEGTSEIMEMTIARDRWQSHLKTRGDRYHEQACDMQALASVRPESGAAIVALALHALAVVLERARQHRLTRSPHVLLRLGEVIAQAEGAASLARRAAVAAEGRLPRTASRRLGAPALAACSRVYARDAALMVGDAGIRWTCGADGASAAAGLYAELRLDEIHAAQAGLLADMDTVAGGVYAGRAEARADSPAAENP